MKHREPQPPAKAPGWLGARVREVQLTFMLLTRLPAGRLANPVPSLGAGSWAFPLAGLTVGAVMAVVLLAALAAGLPPILAAGLALGSGILATGGLHEDGLADVVDGFGGGADRARKLEIMRDSRLGSYGALALILVLGMRWAAVAEAARSNAAHAAWALVAVAMASRATLAAALTIMPPARADGLGKSAAGGSPLRALVACVIGLAGAVLALGPLAGGALLLAAGLAAALMGCIARRQIGGQTGDVLGAMQQCGDLACWIALMLPVLR